MMSTETTTKSCREIISEENKGLHARINEAGNRGRWVQAHEMAWTSATPNNPEAAVVRLVEALAIYADAHAARFESSMGDDGFLGPAWLDILKGTRTLLNGETGRLDCGTVDSMLVRMAQAAGYEEGEL
jgi:hypothetical protein